MNLLKALEGFSPVQAAEKQTAESAAPAPVNKKEPPSAEQQKLNVMAGVLERHEQISNRVRSKREN